MKYPNKLIESHTHGMRSHSTLIKTAKAPKPELPKPELPEPELPELNCTGATDYLSFIIGEPRDGYQLNHTTLVYNISIDGVDYGEHDLTQGYLDLGHMALSVSIGSEGSGTMYASTANGGNPPARFAFTPRSDMVDANFWGINEESNPTAIYNSANRSIQVCMTFSANT